MPKKKTSSKPNITKLKKKLWEKYFSPYIKFKHSIDGKGCNCFTCGRYVEIGTPGLHTGHWLTRAFSYFMWEEDNVRPQCYDCNINKNGNSEVFRRRLSQELGEMRINQMYEQRHLSEKRDRLFYEEKIEEYKEKLEKRKAELGVK